MVDYYLIYYLYNEEKIYETARKIAPICQETQAEQLEAMDDKAIHRMRKRRASK